MTAIWDKAFMKQRERDTREKALAVQAEADWESAELLLEREMSNLAYGFVDVRCLAAAARSAASATRRSVRCEANSSPAGSSTCLKTSMPNQQERRNAAAEGRAPEVERVMKDRVHAEDDDIEDEPPAKSAEGVGRRRLPCPGRECCIAPAASQNRTDHTPEFGTAPALQRITIARRRRA